MKHQRPCKLRQSLPHDVAGEVGGAYYGIKHPMKPHRMRMTNELILEYGLAEHLDVFVSSFLTKQCFKLAPC